MKSDKGAGGVAYFCLSNVGVKKELVRTMLSFWSGEMKKKCREWIEFQDYYEVGYD